MARFCYAINANEATIASYPELLDNSLESLLRFADPEDVIVHYTPPIDYSHVDRLTEMGVTVRMHQEDPVDSKQAMKLYMCDSVDTRLIFLDADTVVYRDPRELYDGTFDIAARPGVANDYLDSDCWDRLCDRYEAERIPYISTGFTLFDAGLHLRIRDDWFRIWNDMKEKGLANPIGSPRYDEMFSFALAVSRNTHSIQYLSPIEHSFEWQDEPVDFCYVREIKRIDGRSWDEVRQEVTDLE